MNCQPSFLRSSLIVVLYFLGLASQAPAAPAHPNVIYFTSFERNEGFDPKLTLLGQSKWGGFGSGGNGILTNSFSGPGQAAYIGFAPPIGTDDIFNVWRPIDLAPLSSNQTLITFSVSMRVVDSTNNRFDDFRWSVYNTNQARLFTLDFDNSALDISYALDDTKGFVSTGVAFDDDGFYDVVIQMNFARNLWSASLNGSIVVNSKPITTVGAALNLGDIDAVWAIQEPGSPGNNYMIFDDYLITAEATGSIPPAIEQLGFSTNGLFHLRVYGEQGLNYVIEKSNDLQKWEPLKEFTAPSGGVFDFQDADASRSRLRFYRTRQKL